MTATAAEPAVVRDTSASGTARWRTIPWSIIALVVPAVVGIVRLVVAIGRPYDFWGDHAIFETAIRRVAQGTQALGPYSRFGFHQPGPAYFDAQAPFYWLTGASPRALFLGALCLNLGSAIGSVLVIRRFFGEGNSRWAALVLGLYLLCLGPALMADPWPVYVLGLPLLFTMLLAAAATRSAASAAASLVAASYLLQTHLATAASVALILAAAAMLTLVMRRDRRGVPDAQRRTPLARRGFTRFTLAATATALGIMWLPPLVEEVTHRPGNVTTLTRFFTSTHAELDQGIDHGLRTSAGRVARQLTVLPGGWSAEEAPARPVDVMVTIAGLVTAGGVLFVGWRRRDTVLAALGGLPLVGVPAAIWSTTRIVGEVHPYLLLWTSVLLLPAWIGAGVVVSSWPVERARRRLASGVVAVGLGAVAVASGLAVSMATWPPLPSSGDVTAAGSLVRGWLRNHAVRNVRVQFSDHMEWPLAAGIINHLERRGTDVTVDRNYVFLFGDQFEPDGRERATVRLAPPDAPPPDAQFESLGEAGGAKVWAAMTRP